MYFRAEMKLNVRIVGDLGVQKPLTLGKIDHMTILVDHRIPGFESGKLIQLGVAAASKPRH